MLEEGQSPCYGQLVVAVVGYCSGWLLQRQGALAADTPLFLITAVMTTVECDGTSAHPLPEPATCYPCRPVVITPQQQDYYGNTCRQQQLLVHLRCDWPGWVLRGPRGGGLSSGEYQSDQLAARAEQPRPRLGPVPPHVRVEGAKKGVVVANVKRLFRGGLVQEEIVCNQLAPAAAAAGVALQSHSSIAAAA